MAHTQSDECNKVQKKRQYGAALKKAEQALAHWQQALVQERQRNQELNEHTWVLSEYLYVQEQLKAIYYKHQQWLQAGGPQGSQQQQQQQHVLSQPGNDAELHRPHWVLHLLQNATWEQLQQALSMDCGQWLAYYNTYFTELLQLSEISKRCHEVQEEMLLRARISGQPQPVPTAYSSSRSTSRESSSFDCCAAAESDSRGAAAAPAWDVIVDRLTETGVLIYLCLLHGHPGLFEASSKDLVAGVERSAPPQHWVTVARRMQFSRQQKLHFKLALETFRRQSRATAAKGVACLQQAPSYAFILACEMISAAQSEVTKDCLMQDAAAPSQPAAAGGHSTGPGASLGQHTPPPQATAAIAGTAADPSSSTDAAPAVCTRSAGAAGSGSSGVPVAASAACSAGGGSGGREQDSREDDLEGLPSADEELQQAYHRYFRDLVHLSIFLADTLTLNQALILNLASYPFYPMLPAVAEVAVDLPHLTDDATASEGLPEVSALMTHRRSFMQQLHEQWVRDNTPATLSGGFSDGL